MIITEQDFQIFLFAVKNNSNYDFSNYSEKSLKRRLAKVLLDNKVTITQLVTSIKKDKPFLEMLTGATAKLPELFQMQYKMF